MLRGGLLPSRALLAPLYPPVLKGSLQVWGPADHLLGSLRLQEQDSAQRSDPNPAPQCRPLGHSCRSLGPSFYLQSPFNFWKSPDALTPYGNLASSQTPGRCGW